MNGRIASFPATIKRRFALCIMATLIAQSVFAVVSPASAQGSLPGSPVATIIVSNLNDSGPGSLRQAMLDANSDAGVDTINFTVTGTIALGSDLPIIQASIAVAASQRGAITISGNGVARVFVITPTTVVTLSNLNIISGVTSFAGDPGGGAAIRNFGVLLVDNCGLTGNTAARGGGAARNFGTMHVRNSTFRLNNALAGGAIHNSGTLTVSGTTFAGNHAGNDGGAIYNIDGTLYVTRSVIGGSRYEDGNTANGGAGILNWGQGVLTVVESQMLGNRASNGGAIENGLYASAQISNSTLNNNQATWKGGAIWNLNAGTMTVRDSTLAVNSCLSGTPGNPGAGGAIRNSDDARLAIGNSRITGNTADYGGGIHNGEHAVLGIQVDVVGHLTPTLEPRYWLPGTTRLSGNVAANGDGGALFNASRLYLANTTIGGENTSFGNRALGGGAGLLNYSGGVAEAHGVTFAYNRAETQPYANGGGIENVIGVVTVTNSTLAYNTASEIGGGIVNFDNGTVAVVHSTLYGNSGKRGANLTNDSGLLTVSRSIVAGSPTGANCFGPITSDDYNLADDNSCLLGGAHDQSSTDPRLGLLADYGGWTWTMSVGTDSSAVDQVPESECALAVDQRGVSRPQGRPDAMTHEAKCDIGAYELTQHPLSTRTIILTNRERLSVLLGETGARQIMRKLIDLMWHPDVDGLLVQVEMSQAVAAAYTPWRSYTDPFANPYAADANSANAIAGAIHSLIQQKLGNDWLNVDYVILVGDDRVVPFRRMPDHTGYPDPSTLTDDFYVDIMPGHVGDHDIYIPDMAAGRLLRTPEQIAGMIDTFLAQSQRGITNAAVAGFDFVADAAAYQAYVLAADGLQVTRMIETSGDPIELFVQRQHGLVSVNTHADPMQYYMPNGGVHAQDFVDSHIDHVRALYWSLGCHAGLNYPYPGWIDFPQAMATVKANYAANTGYGWGGYGTPFSEELVVNFARQIVSGTLSTLGEAFVRAKQQYWAGHPPGNPYDEKVVSEFTLYGLPMYRYDTPPALAHSDAAGSSVKRAEQTRSPDGLTKVRREYTLQYGEPITTPEGTFYTLDGTVSGGDGEPVEPLFRAGVEYSGTQAHGVVFAGGAYTVEMATPALQVLVTTTASYEPGRAPADFTAPDWHPLVFFDLRRVELARGDQETLLATAGQFNPNLSAGNRRTYHGLVFDVYYHDTSDDWTPPETTYMHSVLAGAQAHILVKATDESGIQDVVVAHTDGTGVWGSTALANDGCCVWSGVFTATPGTDFMVQVVDGAGNVTVQNNGNQYFHPGDHFQGGPDVYLPVALRNP